MAIRRGDKLLFSANATTPRTVRDTVLRAVKASGAPLRHVWLATNEADESYLRALVAPKQWAGSGISAHTLRHYGGWLLNLSRVDNYAAFVIELNIMRLARVRISTFHEKGGYYHSHLSNLAQNDKIKKGAP